MKIVVWGWGRLDDWGIGGNFFSRCSLFPHLAILLVVVVLVVLLVGVFFSFSFDQKVDPLAAFDAFSHYEISFCHRYVNPSKT